MLTVEMNPMFVWRLICSIKNAPDYVVDDTQIRTRASLDMNKNPVVFVIPHTNTCYLKLLDAFNVVYADRYNAPSKITKLLDALADVAKHRYSK